MPEARSLSRYRAAVWRGVRHIVIGVVLVAFLMVMIPGGMGWLTMWGLTHPPCASGSAPSIYALNPESVLIPMRTGVDHAGYFFAGSNGATIVVPPAYAADRSALLHEVAILANAGYNVLTYDSRPCAGLAVHSLGIWEAQDILDAVSYLRTRPDVDAARIGLHGFSQAGASNLFAAAYLPEVRAIVAEGGYVDYGVQTLGFGREQGVLMAFFSAGARLGYRMATGLSLAALRPLDQLTDSPPAILLVYGEHEFTLDGAQHAAEDHPQITLWAVPGATHGSYVTSVGSDSYALRVVGFYDQILLQN